MLTIRPITAADEPAFVALHPRCDAAAAGALIEESALAECGAGAMPQRFVFVLQDDADDSGALLGAATLAGATGIDLPRYSYRAGVVVHASAELKRFNRVDTLLLCNDLTGCAEITLPLMASADSARAPQRLLIDAMLLFVVQHPDRFAGRLIAELPGLGVEGGRSSFWHALGRHFHVGNLPDDDVFFRSPDRSHIARLLPKHPLYSSFLGAAAQACIGRRALHARVAAEALQARGFRYRGYVDVFDAGPVVEVDVADLCSVRTGHLLPLASAPEQAVHGAGSCLVVAADAPHFEAGLVQARLDDDAIEMAAADAHRLGLAVGQRLRVWPQGAGALHKA